MTKIALRTLRAHKVRLLLTLISVLLGTAFVAGSFVFTDTLQKSFDTIFATSDRAVDARVQAMHAYQPGVPVGLSARIAGVPGVQAVQDDVTGPLVLVDSTGAKVDTGGAPSVGEAWHSKRASIDTVPSLAAGHAPRRAGQIAVNDGAATRYHLAPGDRVTVVVSNAAPVRATVVGVYHVDYDTGGYLGALFTPAQARALFTDGRHYTSIDVAARPGMSEQTLTARIAAVLPPGLEAKTGTQVRAADSAGVAAALSFVTYLLLGFGIVALLVGTFIIYNTFSMIVAQRQRELALLRAIGASRRQVRRSVVIEAASIGLLGSVLGVAGGVGLAYALRALLDALDLGLPSGGLVLSTRTVLVAVLVGTLVTVVAASAPARRAARIAPVAAMREGLVPIGAASLRRRTALGVVVLVAAGAATIAGAQAASASTGASLVGLGLVGVCAAAMLLAPLLARWVIGPLGRLVGGPFGIVGRLSRTNAVRNPRRTAATAFALTLGLVLVSGIAVIGSSMKASVGKLFADNVHADYILTTNTSLLVPTGAVAAARHVPGVASITELHDVQATVDGRPHEGTALDGPLTAVMRVDIEQGRLSTAGHGMLVSRHIADKWGWTLGTTHRFSVPGSAPITEKVTGIYADDQLIGTWVVGGDVYRALTPRENWADEVGLVHATPGTDLAALRADLERATNRFYIVQVQTSSEFQGQVASQINGLLGLLYGLLGLAIVVAILGIVNTQALSVVERRRELGMLRAVGMQRRQVRRTVYLESLLIAVFGAALGLAIGVGFGSLFARTLRSAGLSVISVPWGQALLFLILAAAVGVLAALWPGIRAARTPPLEAIAAA